MSDFRLLGEEVLATGHVCTYVRGTFATPDGAEMTRDYLKHPGAVSVVPMHADGSVTLVRQYRAAVDAELWEIPAGKRDVAGEDPAVTAQRELVEEVGLAADDVVELARFFNSPGCCDEAHIVYLATGLRPVDADRQGPEEEAMVVETFSRVDVEAMVADGSITDAKTLIGLLAAWRSAPTP